MVAERHTVDPVPTRTWHQVAHPALGELLETDPGRGLDEAEARRRLNRDGSNAIAPPRREGWLERAVEELREPLILLLLGTGVLYSVWGEPSDAVTIFAVILALLAVELANEWRAERAIDALAELAQPNARVRRDGAVRTIPTAELVVGDITLLEAGQRVPADVRLLHAWGLQVDESAFTGEADPVGKDPLERLAADTPLAERANMAHLGTTIVGGHAIGVVVGTGARTELGRIALLAATTEPPRSRLQVAMRDLSRRLVWIALALSVAIPLLQWTLTGQGGRASLLSGLSLAFATIPEELPILVTMVLAVGGIRLARRHGILRRLDAVETLGAVTAIVTDKTGTLTQNHQQLHKVTGGVDTETFLRLAMRSVATDDTTAVTDPIDVALISAARDHHPAITPTWATAAPCDEFSFDRARRRSSVVRADGDLWLVSVKGAPESVLAVCVDEQTPDGTVTLDPARRGELAAAVDELARDGLRVVAYAHAHRAAAPRNAVEAERDLTLIGIAGFADPLRPEAPGALAACRSAGIRVIMATGDHPATASAIARQAGFLQPDVVVTGDQLDAMDDDQLSATLRDIGVFARVSPDHKHRLVQALQRDRHVVAVTGDGINDAPALAAADVGVAMGLHGTDVARGAADLVLADDNFATLVAGVEEGRLLATNLRKAVRFYLAAKVALVATVLVAALLRVAPPFAPVQIIVMELFMDLAASATFVNERAEHDLMAVPPRRTILALDRVMLTQILTAGVGLFAGVAGAFLITRYSDDHAAAQTVAFAAWQLGHVALAYQLRTERQPVRTLGLTTNRYMVAWAAAVLAFLLAAVLLPQLHQPLRTTTLTLPQWALVVVASAVPAGLVVAARQLAQRRPAVEVAVEVR